MLGFLSAKHVVQLGREAFFPPSEPDLPLGRSSILQADDKVPQFGFTGKAYEARRVLLLGINPGNGPDNRMQTAGDARMMPAHHRFAQSPTDLNFVAATLAYKLECQGWPMWKRHCAEVLGAGKLSFDQIAYANCLPWRTQSESGFDDVVAERTAKLYLRPLLEELNPLLVVAMGKRAARILAMIGPEVPEAIIWNRSQAATASVKLQRAEAARFIFDILSRTTN